MTACEIQESKYFWATQYATGGQWARTLAARNYKEHIFASAGEYEMCGCLDATIQIPRGSTIRLNHTIQR